MCTTQNIKVDRPNSTGKAIPLLVPEDEGVV